MHRTGCRQADDDFGLQLGDAGGDLQEPETQGVELRHPPGRALRHQRPQTPHQPIGGGVQEQPHLVGAGPTAGGPVGCQVGLPGLDMIFRVAAPTVGPLIKLFGWAAGQAGDNEPCVHALRPGLDPGDDALGAGPTGGGIVEFLIAPHLVRSVGPGLGAGLQGFDMAAQRLGLGQADDEVDTVSPAPGQDLGRGIVPVAAQQDVDPGPVGPDGPDDAPQMCADFLAGGPLARTQDGGDDAALAIEHDDGLEAILIPRFRGGRLHRR